MLRARVGPLGGSYLLIVFALLAEVSDEIGNAL